jgi:hypothetical protein
MNGLAKYMYIVNREFTIIKNIIYILAFLYAKTLIRAINSFLEKSTFKNPL